MALERRTQRSQPSAAKKKTARSKTRDRDAAPLTTIAMDRPIEPEVEEQRRDCLLGREKRGEDCSAQQELSARLALCAPPPRGRRKVACLPCRCGFFLILAGGRRVAAEACWCQAVARLETQTDTWCCPPTGRRMFWTRGRGWDLVANEARRRGTEIRLVLAFWDRTTAHRGAATDSRDTRAAAQGCVSEASDKLLPVLAYTVVRQPGTWMFLCKEYSSLVLSPYCKRTHLNAVN